MAKKQEEDVIVNVNEVYSKSEQFFEDNKSMIYGIVALVVIGAVGFFAYNVFVKQPKQEEASIALSEVQYNFQKDSLDAVLEEADYLADKYSSVPAGKLASYYAGIAARDNGDYETALEYFKNADFDDAVVGIMALGNVGDMYIELENVEEGIVWLEKAANKSKNSTAADAVAPVYFQKAGDAYLYLEDYSNAKKMYKTIIDNYESFRDLYKVEEKYYSLINK